jgi:hypothetical protein
MTQTETPTTYQHHGATFVLDGETAFVTVYGDEIAMTRDEARDAWESLSAQHRSYQRPADVALGGRILHGW